jgi:hypothetical protein
MENKYLKIVSKKDFNFDEFIHAYLLKHHNNETYITYMLSVFSYKEGPNNYQDGGWISLKENKINHNEE